MPSRTRRVARTAAPTSTAASWSTRCLTGDGVPHRKPVPAAATPPLVHHAIFFRVAPGEAASRSALDDATPRRGLDLLRRRRHGRPARALDSAWVGAWAPGGSETLLAPGVGYPMRAGQPDHHAGALQPAGAGGSRVARPVRHPAAADRPAPADHAAGDHAAARAGRAAVPAGRIAARCATATPRSPTSRSASATTPARPRTGLHLLCGGGAPSPAPTQSCDRPVRRPGRIRAVAGHMHLLGRSIRIDVNPGTPNARTLLDIPAYNFDDQGSPPLADAGARPGGRHVPGDLHARRGAARPAAPVAQAASRGTSSGARAPATRCAWAS